MNKIFLISLTLSMLFVGCATTEGPEYSGATYNQIKRYDIAMVVDKCNFLVGDRVKIIRDGNRVARVERVAQ